MLERDLEERVEGGVLISSYEHRVTKRTYIRMIVLCRCLRCAPALGLGAQVLPGGLKLAESGLQLGKPTHQSWESRKGLCCSQPQMMAHVARYCYFQQFFLCVFCCCFFGATCQYCWECFIQFRNTTELPEQVGDMSVAPVNLSVAMFLANLHCELFNYNQMELFSILQKHCGFPT